MALGRSELQRALEHLQASDWQAAHEIVQKDEDSPLACWAHGIVHLMEGDLANARYWYREAKRAFPADPDAKLEIVALGRALEA
ncbi:MAG TPA: hypothetical protein VFA72_00660 [Burkholderiales bacterium]|nr:hypothetical protein [Burkholderiales bacterium]